MGYQVNNWNILENDLRKIIFQNEAIHIEDTLYGQLYKISSNLIGSNTKSLLVCAIWMKETPTGAIKFITMYPDRREK